MVTVSLILLPKSTVPVVAAVVTMAVCGWISKHSFVAASNCPVSSELGTPSVVEVNSARQQYLPAAVTNAGSAAGASAVETTHGLVWPPAGVVCVPIRTPPVPQVKVVPPRTDGPHRWKATDPSNVGMPVTVTV